MRHLEVDESTIELMDSRQKRQTRINLKAPASDYEDLTECFLAFVG